MLEVSNQNGGATTANVMVQSYKTPQVGTLMRHLLLQTHLEKLHFHSASGDVTEASVGDANSTNNVTDHSFGSNRTNNNSTMLFDDPRSKISPSAVMTGRMFAVKQAAMVLLSASPSTVTKFHCPYCSDWVERKISLPIYKHAIVSIVISTQVQAVTRIVLAHLTVQMIHEKYVVDAEKNL